MQGLKSWLKKIFCMASAGRPGQQATSFFASKKTNGETSVLQPAYTVRLKPDPDLEQLTHIEQESACTETSIAWCGLTDTGRVRAHNEDFFSCMDLPDGSLFVVADGMGGHDAGEVASRLAVEAVSREVRDHAERKAPEELLEQAVRKANADVLREANGKGSNMGTTLTLALVLRDSAYVANVGDSRTYWIENGSIKRITTDHSLVEKLVSLGKLGPEEARKHPKSNVLYRTIGSEGLLPVDTFRVPLRKGGSLLLCSDGLWGEVADETIHQIFMTEKDTKKICLRLIKAANASGGKDNITAVVVKII